MEQIQHIESLPLSSLSPHNEPPTNHVPQTHIFDQSIQTVQTLQTLQNFMKPISLEPPSSSLKNPNPQQLPPSPSRSPHSLPHPPLSPSTLHHILSSAIHQRKLLNLTSLRSYHSRHHLYYLNHCNILSYIHSQLSHNISRTRTLYNEIFQYFEFVRDGWRGMAKHWKKEGVLGGVIGEVQVGSKGKGWYGGMREGLIGLVQVKRETAERAEHFHLWLQQTLLPKLHSAANQYQSSILAYQSAITPKSSLAQQTLKNFSSKFLSIEKLVLEPSPSNKVDLLHQQLLLCDIARHVKEKVEEWGRLISGFWGTLMNNEMVLMHAVQKIIQMFFFEYSKVVKDTQLTQGVSTEWQKLKTDEDTFHSYSIQTLLVQDQKQFLHSCISSSPTSLLKNIDFQKFVQLQRYSQLIGSLDHIIQGLYTKRFNCKAEGSMGDVWVYWTVDGWLVFVWRTNGKVMNRMRIEEVEGERKGERKVEVRERGRGWLGLGFGKGNKEGLEFGSRDQVEEFMFVLGKGQEVEGEEERGG